MIRMIATDMDGTLLDSRKRMPQDLERVAAALAGRGVTLIAASGRQYNSLVRDFGSMAEHMAFIAENGALVMEGGRRLFIEALAAEDLAEILQAAKGLEGVYPVICRAGGAMVEESSSESFIRMMRMYYEDTQVVPSLVGCCAEFDDVCKIAFYDEGDAAAHLLPVALYSVLTASVAVFCFLRQMKKQ